MTTRQDYARVEEDITNHHQLTSRLPGLREDGKDKLSAELTGLISKREEIKKKLDDNIAQLVKTNSWPVAPRSEREETDVKNYEETMNYITELKETASEMNALLNDLREQKSSTSMDVDQNPGDPSSRPLKRRRLSDGEQSSWGTTNEEFEAMRERITTLEGRFSNFENDLTAHDAELRDEMEERMEAKFEEMVPQGSTTASTTRIEERCHDLEFNIDTTGGQVEELASEVGDLILQSNNQEKEIAAVKRQLEETNKVQIQVCNMILFILFSHQHTRISVTTTTSGLYTK